MNKLNLILISVTFFGSFANAQFNCSSTGVVTNPDWVNGNNKICSTCPEVNVGIGRSNPRVRLDVNGGTFTNTICIGEDPLTATARLHVTDNRVAVVGTSEPVMIIQNSQQQLLKLDNTGLLRSREILVDAEIWPDYVFAEEYVLMPLDEVEQFISENGHLPNVPSADEIVSEGQNLGEMNQLLMEKIEELTLYMIQLQDEVENLKEELNK